MARKIGVLTAALVLASTIGAAGAGGTADAGTFIESLADKAVNALTIKEITRDERIRRFRLLLNEHFDVPTIGRWVLGRHWPTASREQRDEYLRLFEDLIVDTYVDRFAEYSGETLVVTGEAAVDDIDTVVSTRIIRPSDGPPVRVDWRLRKRDARHHIIDVIVEGVSMGVTQRSEFASYISQHGGTVESLLARLRQRR